MVEKKLGRESKEGWVRYIYVFASNYRRNCESWQEKNGTHQTIEAVWLMSFTNDESFRITRIQFIGGTIFDQTVLISRPNSWLLWPNSDLHNFGFLCASIGQSLKSMDHQPKLQVNILSSLNHRFSSNWSLTSSVH